MSHANWHRMDELFHATLARQASERQEFLRRECGTDRGLFGEVWSLIVSFEADRDFLEQSALGAGAKLLTTVEDRRLGQRLGVYRIVSELGRGGMGAVYLAARDDEEFQQRVAIKIARENSAPSGLRERFRRERQILANLSHPNIARLLDGGTTADGTPYFVMEYVRGLNLVEYAARHGLSVNERLQLFLKVCDAVSYAHAQGVIHRDLKPTNVLVTNEKEPKLLDFGIAKVLQDNHQAVAHTRMGFHLFTPEYSSPEQARGENLTTASDIYSLGVLLYELLTTRHPFDFANRSPLEIARIVCESEPERPSTAVSKRSDTLSDEELFFDSNKVYETSRLLRGDLDNIVLMAMRKEPGRRYPTVDDLAADLRRYLENQPVKARPNSIFYRSAKLVRRNGKLTAALAACVLLLAVLPALYLTVLRGPAPTRHDAANRLTFNPAADNFPRFAADGRIVFVRLQEDSVQILAMKTDGSDEKPFAENLAANRIALAPDGKKVAFRSSRDNRYYVTADEGKSVRQSTAYRAGRAAWSPDAQRLVFSYNFGEDLHKTDEPFYRERDNVEIFSVNADGTNEQNLTNNPAFDSDACFSPDGKRIAFASERDGNFEIYTMDADGKNVRRLTKNESDDTKPAWSPDGQHIAFTSNRDGDEEIYLMNPDGTNQRRLTDALGDDAEPAWSPDGGNIVFAGASDGNKEIYLIKIPPDFFTR